jgi:formate-dependent nitrite reductase membrane component NrfD
MGMGILTGGVDFHTIEYASRIVLGINALLVATYLLNSSYQSSTAHLSVTEMLRGRVAVLFWLGIVLCGIIIPLVVSFLSIFTWNGSIPLLIGVIICHTFGAFALKYCILKVGIHKPIVPKIIH